MSAAASAASLQENLINLFVYSTFHLLDGILSYAMHRLYLSVIPMSELQSKFFPQFFPDKMARKDSRTHILLNCVSQGNCDASVMTGT
jgi:hypothetical protein